MKLSILFVSILIGASTSFAVNPQNRPVQTAEGRFQKVEMGDYMHLILTGENNQRLSFVCPDLPKSLVKGVDCNDLLAKPELYKDRALKVTYYIETNFIPEAQEKITWKYVDKIEFKKQ